VAGWSWSSEAVCFVFCLFCRSSIGSNVQVACCDLIPPFPDFPTEWMATVEANIINQGYTYVQRETYSEAHVRFFRPRCLFTSSFLAHAACSATGAAKEGARGPARGGRRHQHGPAPLFPCSLYKE